MAPPDPTSRLARVRANLTFESAAFRHAVRLAACVGVGDALGRVIDLQRTYWIPMTIAIVLRPDFTSTFSRGILRILGTLAGLLIATGLFHFLPPGKISEILLIALFVFLLRWIGPAHYGVFVTALSAFIVLFIAITGVSPKDVITARALNTLSGGAIALIAYGVWPTWESSRIMPVLADMVEAYKDYFSAVVQAYKNRGDSTGEIDRARVRARLKRTNAEGLIERVAAEPGLTVERATLLHAMLITLYNFVRSVLAIESAMEIAEAPPRAATIEFAGKVECALDAMAQALRSGQALPRQMPDLREAHNQILASTEEVTEQYALINMETDRITTSVNTLGEQIAAYRQVVQAA